MKTYINILDNPSNEALLELGIEPSEKVETFVKRFYDLIVCWDLRVDSMIWGDYMRFSKGALLKDKDSRSEYFISMQSLANMLQFETIEEVRDYQGLTLYRLTTSPIVRDDIEVLEVLEIDTY